MRRLLLIGGGHAHLEVLRQVARGRLVGGEIVLVSTYPRHHYSSMVPGFLQGTYAERDLVFDLPALCRAAGAAFREGSATRVDPAGRWADVAGGRIECDVLSVDVGSSPAGLDAVPGAAEHALTVRPMSRAVELRRRLDALVTDGESGPAAVCVVGAGAGGVEVALAVARRIATSGRRAEVTLVDRGTQPFGGDSPRMRRALARRLTTSEVRLVAGRAAAGVDATAVTLDSGERVPSMLTVWLTGAAPAPLTSASDLPKDERGFWLVDDTLRSVGGGAVWGAGDCVSLRGHLEVAKAGVYAVREGPVLAANLRTAIERGPEAPMRRYVPQQRFLTILNTADERALLRWHGVVAHARWAWWLKDAIDRRFMAKYQRHERAPAQVEPVPVA